LTGRTKTGKESESEIRMCDRMQMYNITILPGTILDIAMRVYKRNLDIREKLNVPNY
jgi:hypothetical protein